MSYDHRADENGVFEMLITKWHGGEQIGEVRVTGLGPYEKLETEVVIIGNRD